MLYKKNKTKKLDMELFQNPTAEYRGTPFWAWNCKLDQKELEWQLEIFKKMGFGGAHMHVRTGMATPYLSDEYMELVKACVKKAKSENMLAWLYDEDRWPSGAAGGLVTKDERYRARYLLFTPFPYGSKEGRLEVKNGASAHGGRTEQGTLLACYDIELDENGYLVSSRIIEEQEDALYEKWYAYLEINTGVPWFNNQTYINMLDKAAVDRFIEITYESYNRTVAEEFDNTVPAIFTDEPQFVHKSILKYATDKTDITLPWTDDFVETYAQTYDGEDIMEGLPEVIWERVDRKPSVLRYHFHDYVCERFCQAFADNCGKWCNEHGVHLTGHMPGEPALRPQTASCGEAMRFYRSFGLPGIDMLCGSFEYTTAKQTQSAVHQYEREGMTSELYGVTNWDFDFRGHKLHGDWQAALGVTVRVPHLSWVSMAGEAKRDYPASIHYQSPWYEKYPLIEDHFARLNTALTRGKPIVKVGVIHPIENCWLHFGPVDHTAAIRENMDKNFQNITKWLLLGGVDFDFISESLLPDLCKEAGAPFKVGAMEYDMILVPGCETLRSTTLERLEGFLKAGGKLIFVGDVPKLEDACPSNRGRELAKNAQCIQFDCNAVLEAVEDVRLVEMRDETGAMTNNLLYQLRKDGDGQWLFIAHGCEPYNKHISKYQDLRIRVKGNWKATVYNTMNGELESIDQTIIGEITELRCRMYDYDSMLVWLESIAKEEISAEFNEQQNTNIEGEVRNITLPVKVPYTLSEPNALLLDQAEYALDEGEWQAKEEILRLDDACRKQLDWPSRKEPVAQAWTIKEEPITHTMHLRWEICSEIEYEGAELAIEDAEKLQLKWNGEVISNTVTGWYVDKAIKTVALPVIKKGINILEAAIPFGKRTDVEWAYILGDFGVEVSGKATCIIAKREELAFGDITTQGLPFYGGNVTYHVPVETKGGALCIRSGYYVGAMQEVSVDGEECIPLITPPYTAKLDSISAGRHTFDFTLYGHRGNGFGPVHMTDIKEFWFGPRAWRTEGDKWCYEYRIHEQGILTTPEITEQMTQKKK